MPNITITQHLSFSSILEPAVSNMSSIVVPDDVIHQILEYTEVLDVIRARLVRQHSNFLGFNSDFSQMARRVRWAIDSSYELAIRIRLFSLCIPISFRYTSGLNSMDLPRQLGHLDQLAEAWQRLRPTTRIRLQDFNFVQLFDPQGNIHGSPSF